MKRIITISREFGAGGGTIGMELARKLNYECYNKELILMAAAKSNIDVMRMIEWDEKVPMNLGFAQSLFEFYNKPLSERLFAAQSDVIQKIGEKGRCVIIGRNANSILKEFDSCLNVFVHADFDWRFARMEDEMENMSSSQIANEIRAIDKARRKYCSFHTGHEFGMADNYDICLNSSKLGIDKCVEILYDLAK